MRVQSAHIYPHKDRYFEFDINEVGDQNLTLLHNYDFTNILGYQLCELDFMFDVDSQAIQIISINSSCTDKFPGQRVSDCGVYRNIFRHCLLVEYLLFPNGDNVYAYMGNQTNDFYCPNTYMKITPLANSDPKSSNPFKLNITTIARNIYDNKTLIDGAFILSVRTSTYFDNRLQMNNGNQTFPYNDPDAFNILTAGDIYGFSSSVVKDFQMKTSLKLQYFLIAISSIPF